MEIANIVTDKKLNLGPEFNVVDTMDEIVYKNLPTLVIGYKEICDIYSKDVVNVLKRNVSKNIFWTFNKNVDRDIYHSDIEDFIRHVYKAATSNLNFVDLDVIQFSTKKLRKIVKKLLNTSDFITYKSNNNVLFLYSNNLIFGIDLHLLEYVGLDTQKIEDKIKLKSSVFLSGDEILIEYNNHLERLNYELKYLPFLYSINPHD